MNASVYINSRSKHSCNRGPLFLLKHQLNIDRHLTDSPPPLFGKERGRGRRGRGGKNKRPNFDRLQSSVFSRRREANAIEFLFFSSLLKHRSKTLRIPQRDTDLPSLTNSCVIARIDRTPINVAFTVFEITRFPPAKKPAECLVH